ncbi:hypothetical protein COT97_05620 [Candidatus Falkowbacteria bacterium CG10_big_fil_rev_8_21_14_0_10_39_11]|uniref:NIF system FeS cluster assembly NifU C-terminal domain-containing protein n=1 Tax=Candidatus Falkowbacteria bacterium CG10_big_fil_rev_8_21_14_0_10_39_11 TaxID=1974565 RepID=A0A2H0V3H2_9BACT|nr:MAG: hypothetical protein COT97_05620 [Candidatus Falkowbacteria bacterium CG10_big_fil_rev_8_21_14_0_10_39_11]
MTFKENIEKALEEVRPLLQMDGGDIELVEANEQTKEVKVKFLGMCSGCPMTQFTLENNVEAKIKEQVPEVKSVTL